MQMENQSKAENNKNTSKNKLAKYQTWINSRMKIVPTLLRVFKFLNKMFKNIVLNHTFT